MENRLRVHYVRRFAWIICNLYICSGNIYIYYIYAAQIYIAQCAVYIYLSVNERKKETKGPCYNQYRFLLVGCVRVNVDRCWLIKQLNPLLALSAQSYCQYHSGGCALISQLGTPPSGLHKHYSVGPYRRGSVQFTQHNLSKASPFLFLSRSL